MKPKVQKHTGQGDFFRPLLINTISSAHGLVRLSKEINWIELDKEFGSFFHEKQGRPGIPTRKMIGLLLLKYMTNQSDEGTCKIYAENPYWQYFCGEEYFEYKPPMNRSSFSQWRKKIEPDKLKTLLKETLNIAQKKSLLKMVNSKKLYWIQPLKKKLLLFQQILVCISKPLELCQRRVRGQG